MSKWILWLISISEIYTFIHITVTFRKLQLALFFSKVLGWHPSLKRCQPTTCTPTTRSVWHHCQLKIIPQGATQEHCGTHEWTKRQGNRGLFQPRMRKAGKAFRGLKFNFSGKRGGFVKIYSNSSDSDLLRGSNLRQNPTKFLFRGWILHHDWNVFRGIF